MANVARSFSIVAADDVDETMCASIHFECVSTMLSSVFPNTGLHDQCAAEPRASRATPRDVLGTLQALSELTDTQDIS